MVEGSAVLWFGALGLEVTGVEEAQGEVVARVQTPGGQVVLCGSCGCRARSKGRHGSGILEFDLTGGVAGVGEVFEACQWPQ